MNIKPTPIKDLYVIEPKIWKDDRGYFFESFHQQALQDAGIDVSFVQDNQSLSQKNTLRGLHFQAPPFAQAKLVRVVRGSVLDIALDLRKNSPTYGQHYSLLLSESNHLQLYIPEGFAHGFVALEDDTVFCYKCTAYYNKQAEGGIRWDDPGLKIDWQTSHPIISEKDLKLPPFEGFVSPFFGKAIGF